MRGRLLAFLLCAGALSGGAADAQIPGFSIPGPGQITMPSTTAPSLLPALAPEPTVDQSKSVSLNLTEACKIALAKSPRIGTALAKIRVTEAESEEAAAAVRPHGALVVQGPPPPANLSILRQNLAFAPLRVELRQLLLDGGKYAAKINQLKALADSNSREAQAEWHQLHLDVTIAYFDLLRARAQEQVASESLGLAQKQLLTAEKRFQAGDVPKGDVLLARVPVSESELEVARSHSVSSGKQESLNLLMGLPVDTPLQLSDPPPPQALGLDLPQCLAQAREQRPSLAAYRLSLVAAEHGISAAERDSRPQLSVTAGLFGLSGDSFISQIGVEGGLELSWPFLDGGLTNHLTDAAKASRDQATTRLQEQERQTESEVRQAYRAVEISRLSEESSGVQLDQSQDAFRIASAQYRAGIVNFYPLRQAQLDLLKAKQGRSGAMYDYLTARARLDFARGQEPEANFSLPVRKDLLKPEPPKVVPPPPAQIAPAPPPGE